MAAICTGSSLESLSGAPLSLRITSPDSMPARSAGPPFSTLDTSAPSGCGRPKESASPWVTGWITTPSLPRVTWPVVCSCSPTCMATSIGMENRSEEHTSELQSPCNLVCRLLLEKKNTQLTLSLSGSHGHLDQSAVRPKVPRISHFAEQLGLTIMSPTQHQTTLQ